MLDRDSLINLIILIKFILIIIKLIMIKLITSLPNVFEALVGARTPVCTFCVCFCAFLCVSVFFGTRNLREFHLSPATSSPRETTLLVVEMLVDPRCFRENYIKL